MLRKFCLAPLRFALFVLPCAPERLVASNATNGLRSFGTLGFCFILSPFIIGTPNGTRTRVSALKGQRPNH